MSIFLFMMAESPMLHRNVFSTQGYLRRIFLKHILFKIIIKQ